MLEIAMLIFGIVTLVRGKFYVSKTRAAVGGPAYLAGVVLLLPLPLAFTGGFIYGAMMAAEGREIDNVQLLIAEVILVVICLVIAYIIGNMNAKDVSGEATRERKPRQEDEEEEEYQTRRRRDE